MSSDNFTKSYEPSETTTARRHAHRATRRVKRGKGPSKAVRYIVSILIILMVFYLLFSIGSWIVGNFTDNDSKVAEEDPITKLEKELAASTLENQELKKEIAELNEQINRYNEKYGPLDGTNSPTQADSAFGSEPSSN